MNVDPPNVANSLSSVSCSGSLSFCKIWARSMLSLANSSPIAGVHGLWLIPLRLKASVSLMGSLRRDEEELELEDA